MYPNLSFTIYPLSEQALVIDFGQRIEFSIHQLVLRCYDHLRANPLPVKHEWVPAYSSLTLYFDLFALVQHTGDPQPFAYLDKYIREKLSVLPTVLPHEHRVHSIPVCYDPVLAPDLNACVQRSGLSLEELIRLHTAIEYQVCFLGFLPGFAYMAEVDERIAFPRKQQPADRVHAGSVGIAGRQTGIYPLASPGGWQVIGRTPLHLFDPEKEIPVLFQPGDRVRFYSINHYEFDHYEGGVT
ncbi:MAG: 5-oxoprolinase subunit PxpB [Chitinophagales bacterium]|nr:5-oxoprolinase subunit PxpB [Chitinophagales bacterium]